MNNKDTQSYAYQITINNPADKGLTHDTISHLIINNFKTVDYFCMSDEKGSTYHTHVYIHFSSRVRFSTVKKHFETAHIESAKALVSDNIDYIKKEGKWAQSDKSETKIEGTFEEWGTRPHDSKGRRSDLSELYQLIEAGYSNSEILAINQDYILNIDKLDKLRTTLLTDKYKNEFRTELKTVYVYGSTGTGKSRGIYQRHAAKDIYRVVSYEHPFDSYSLESVLVLEEFRSCLQLKEMLEILDIYPLELRARYCNKVAAYTTCYIISNWPLERQYQEVQKNDIESWKAFLRRITEVWEYKSKGEIVVYDSVEKYLKRDSEFISLSKQEQMEIPF